MVGMDVCNSFCYTFLLMMQYIPFKWNELIQDAIHSTKKRVHIPIKIKNPMPSRFDMFNGTTLDSVVNYHRNISSSKSGKKDTKSEFPYGINAVLIPRFWETVVSAISLKWLEAQKFHGHFEMCSGDWESKNVKMESRNCSKTFLNIRIEFYVLSCTQPSHSVTMGW